MTEKWKRQRDSILTKSIRSDSSWPRLVEGDARNSILTYLEDRFGIPLSTFDRYLLLKRWKSIWLLRNSDHTHLAFQFRVSMVGMRAFQIINDFIKPSTRMIQLFGHRASKAKIDVDEEQLATLLDQGSLDLESRLEDGYLIICFKGRILGLGLLVHGKLRSQLPVRDLRYYRQATPLRSDKR